MKTNLGWFLLAANAIVALLGCGGTDGTAQVVLADDALTYEQFLSVVYQEPSDDEGPGVFVANGDEVFDDEAELRAFYDATLAGALRDKDKEVRRDPLVVDLTSGGADNAWPMAQRRKLTYCVSTKFGSRYRAVVAAMASATSAWEAAANIDFVHIASQDWRCTKKNTSVLFDVNPMDTGGRYLARAFFPDTGRRNRNVLIDRAAFNLPTPLTLTGILRHELGHALGFRHEHTRPEAGVCFEDDGYRPLTPYDAASVMHYPHCNGDGDWSLVLTTMDKTGARRLYP